jgi:hypothetical protein
MAKKKNSKSEPGADAKDPKKPDAKPAAKPDAKQSAKPAAKQAPKVAASQASKPVAKKPRASSGTQTRAAASSPTPGHASAALTPAPALPVSERGKRERATRGGKSTMSTHEFLAEVLPQPPPLAAPGETLTLTQIYETLAALLVPYARKMESEMHPKIGFCLKAKSARTGRETHFGAVQVLPDCVAYHLFPLYAHPDLLKNVSPELHSRLRSQTCFHFETLHAGLVAELAELTHAGFERFVADGVI